MCLVQLSFWHIQLLWGPRWGGIAVAMGSVSEKCAHRRVYRHQAAEGLCFQFGIKNSEPSFQISCTPQFLQPFERMKEAGLDSHVYVVV